MRVLLTGASGTVGGKTLMALQTSGYEVVTLGRRRPRDRRGDHMLVDLSIRSVVEQARRHVAVAAAHRRYDACVFAAGVDCLHGIQDIDAEVLDQVMQVNCNSHLQLLRGVLTGHKKDCGPLAVVAISSDVVGRPQRQSVTYAASKAALEEGLRHATQDAHLRVLLIRLPYIGVPMGNRVVSAAAEY